MRLWSPEAAPAARLGVFPVDVNWQRADAIPMSDSIPEEMRPPAAARAGEGRGSSKATEGAELAMGELCRRTGLSARTVRYYEELGLLPGVRRRAGGRRVYGEDELERLHFIGRLKTLGLSLGEIKELNALYAHAGSTHDMLERLHALLGDHLGELDQRIVSLTQLRQEMSGYRKHVARRLDARADPPADAAGPEDDE